MANQKILEFDSKEEFEEYIEANALEIQFENDSDEARYEEVDGKLAKLLNQYFIQEYGKENEDVLFHQIWDWWPNCTRFFELGIKCLTPNLFNDLSSYLEKEFRDWQINITFYQSLSSYDDDYVGSVNIYSDKILIIKGEDWP